MSGICSVTRIGVLLLSGWLLQADIARGDAPIFRCRDESGMIEFSQTGCRVGSGEPVVVKSPRIGWLRPKVLNRDKNSRGGREMQPNAAAESSEGGGSRTREERCWKARQRLERVGRQLRGGYKPAQGERLRRQRREQSDYIYQFCRQ